MLTAQQLVLPLAFNVEKVIQGKLTFLARLDVLPIILTLTLNARNAMQPATGALEKAI